MIRAAAAVSPKSLSISTAGRISGSGFAVPGGTASWVAPYTASYTLTPSPTLIAEVALMPPTRPAPRSLSRSPYRLPAARISNWCGLDTSCMQVLSTIISFAATSGKSTATRRKQSRYRPSASFKMFALWMQWIDFLPSRWASAKV